MTVRSVVGLARRALRTASSVLRAPTSSRSAAMSRGKTGRYTAEQLLNYTAVDLTSDGVDESMRERDEFNSSVDIQLSEAPIDYVRRNLVTVSRVQFGRKAAA
jgi:hypothetical protein